MGYHKSARYRIATAAVTCALVFAPATAFLTPTVALAEDTDLESLQNAAIAAGDAYQQAQQKVDDLQSQIDQNQDHIDQLNDQMPQLREAASSAIRTQYKLSQDQPNLIGMLLSSNDLTQFIAQLHYLDAVASSNSDAINSLAQAQSDLESTQAALNSQLQQADQQKDEAQKAMEDAQQKAEAAQKKAQEEAAANQAAYEAAQAAGQQDPTVTEVQQAASDASNDSSAAQAADTSSSDSSQAASQDQSSQASSSASTDSGSSSSNASSSSSSSNSSSSNSSNGSSNGGSSSSSSSSSSNNGSSNSSSSSSSSASFTYVLASMYGNGDGCMYSATASGDIVTPTSMGVAMKTMPLGTVIEITYNGRTVTAVVNDRGPYVGNRQIDLQPAVAAALGFDGVGTVGYRVVG